MAPTTPRYAETHSVIKTMSERKVRLSGQRIIVKFLAKEDVKPAEFSRRLRGEFPFKDQVYDWHNKGVKAVRKRRPDAWDSLRILLIDSFMNHRGIEHFTIIILIDQ